VKHTKGPFYRGDIDATRGTVFDAYGHVVAKCPNAEIAEQFARDANCHDELVDFAQEISAQASLIGADHSRADLIEKIERWQSMADAILAKATS